MARFKKLLAVGKTERYVYHAAADLMQFGKGRERRSIHEIHHDELERCIDSQRIQKRGPRFGQKWGLSTRRTNMSLFSSLWEVAIAKGWATLSIVDRLEPVGKLGRQKRIYSNETALNLMGEQECLLDFGVFEKGALNAAGEAAGLVEGRRRGRHVGENDPDGVVGECFGCDFGPLRGMRSLSLTPQREFLEGPKGDGVPFAEAMPLIAPLFPPVKSREERQWSDYPPHLQLCRTVT